ncbi:glucosaminidase domain-containing protein [Streptococcus jiangjianxini]|uniref:glucosaminidase domain-containing protein n=1 Tax=Streptococcus jiangjianxini TaxID=3161189 RepID=UPI00386C10C1
MARRRRKRKLPIRTVLLAIAMTFAIVIFVKQVLPEGTESVPESSVSEQFIQEIGPKAQVIARDNDLYASVMIAQAILESNSGQSRLSQSPHYNFFGIKGNYQGQSVALETWEDDGQGNPYTITADFRSYGSLENSLEDYAQFLDRDFYRAVHKSNTLSYHDATKALTGTYATDTSYGRKLNNLIETYQLTKYDSLW